MLMKKSIITIAVLLLLSMTLFAQKTNPVSASSSHKHGEDKANVNCSSSAGPDAASIDKEEILRMVKKQLPSWLGKIPSGSEKNYGFQNREEFEKAIPGDLFPVYTFTKRFFDINISADSNYLKFTGQIRIPLIVDNEYRALITVSGKAGNWNIRDFGSVGLAGELQHNLSLANGNESSIKILRIYQLNSDFLFLTDPASPSASIALFPLHSANINMPELSTYSTGALKLSELQVIVKSKISVQSE
jgi:hypothetical protein